MISNNQQDRFVSIIETHKGIIYKIVNTYCQDAEERKDLAQEIIMKLWKAFDRFDPQLVYSTWMYKIALNVAISHYRREKRRKTISNPYSENIFDISELAKNPDTEESNAFLRKFISELKELDKALMLLYLEEKTNREIAEIMGITETNVATKISRIKIILKQKFSQKAS
jgi:RNA polymerase sigma factor (sigma-70 family)